jgi:hypothetical protein
LGRTGRRIRRARRGVKHHKLVMSFVNFLKFMLGDALQPRIALEAIGLPNPYQVLVRLVNIFGGCTGGNF